MILPALLSLFLVQGGIFFFDEVPVKSMPPKKRKIGGGEEKTRKKKRTKKPRDTSDECDEFSSFSDDNEHQGIVTPIEPGIAGNEGNAVLDAAVDGDGKVVSLYLIIYVKLVL